MTAQVLSDAPHRPAGRPPRAAWAVVAVALACCAGCSRPRADFARLLDGDARVEVRSMLVTGQGGGLLLGDADSARYLGGVLRSAQPDPPALGLTYAAEVRLASGQMAEVALFVPTEGDWLALAWPLDKPTYYRLDLPQPMPAAVADALRRLRTPPDEPAPGVR